MLTRNVRAFFDKLPRSVVPRYTRYWRSLTPVDYGEIFRRWLFAFCSVHTSWQGNVRGYESVRDYAVWLKDKASLVTRLTASRTGMHNMKANFIWAFARKFWDNPLDYVDWTRRDELVEETTGLGLAKVSFALNMVRPVESRVVCLDVHMLRLYGMEQLDYKSARGFKMYKRAEADWVARCAEVPPYIGHSIYWDRVHGEYSPSYWSYVFE